MKNFVLLVVFSVTFSAGTGNVLKRDDLEMPDQTLDFEVQNYLDDFIRAIINNFKDVIINGNKCAGIPPLDPLNIPAFPLNMNSTLLKMHGNITKIQSMGLKTLEAKNVSTNLISLGVALEMGLSELYVSGDYDVNGLAALIFPIYGKGPFFLRVAEVKIDGGGSLGVRLNGSLFLKELTFSMELGELFVNFEGLLGGGELGEVLNQIVNDMGVTVFNTVMEILHDTLETVLLQFINFQLQEVLLADIIGGIIKPPDSGNCTFNNDLNKFM